LSPGYCSCANRALHSFPTRRSSDLEITEGAYQAVERLGALGHRRIGLVSELLEWTYHQDILRGYRQGLAALGQEAQKEWVQASRSEEHTSELQSREKLVCRLLLEKN